MRVRNGPTGNRNDRLLSLDAVHERTGERPMSLRQWCATGKLACERADGAWLVPEPQLPLVRALGRQRARIVATRRAIGMVVPLRRVTYDLGSRVERALGLRAGATLVTALALDDEDYLVAVWPNDPELRGAAAVSDLADDLGGDLLDDDMRAR
jgi:hypothetical protein